MPIDVVTNNINYICKETYRIYKHNTSSSSSSLLFLEKGVTPKRGNKLCYSK